MRKNDFISANLEYIESLKAAGERATEAEWTEIIEAECKEYGQEFESHEIGWIIEELDEAGLVKGETTMNTENTMKAIASIYNEIGIEDITVKEVLHDMDGNFLTISTTRAGKDVVWYLTDSKNICIEIESGRMLTEEEIEEELC